MTLYVMCKKERIKWFMQDLIFNHHHDLQRLTCLTCSQLLQTHERCLFPSSKLMHLMRLLKLRFRIRPYQSLLASC